MSTNLNVLFNAVAFNNSTGCQIVQYPTQILGQYKVLDYNLGVTAIQQIPFTLAPGASTTLFNTSTTVNLTATSAFQSTFVSGSTYQIQETDSQQPGFRTLRNIGVSSDSVFSVVVNNSALVTYTNTGGTLMDASGISSGDILYVDAASPFAAGNKGSFSVISSTTASISIQNSNAVGQTSVTLGASYASQFKVFSAAGVQVGDSVNISAGFSPAVFGTYQVTQVTDNSFQFISTQPLPLETGIMPTSTGIVFYGDSPFYIFLSTDEAALLQFNAETGTNGTLVEPISLGFNNIPSFYTKSGTSYALKVTNKSQVNTLNGTLLTMMRA